jgi:hypothetical protein
MGFHDTFEKYKRYLQSDEISYKQTILGIIDILGFRTFLDKSKEMAPKKICQTIAQNLIPTETLFHRLRFKMLSDTLIVYSDQIDDYSTILEIIFALDTFRTGLIEEGFFSRGAVVFGDNFMDNDIMISPAFIKAYEIEEEICNNPRIIIEDCLIEKMLNNKDDIIEKYLSNHHESKILNESNSFKNYYDNLSYVFDEILHKDDDLKYIIYPFIGMSDIALYYFDKYIATPRAELVYEKERYIESLINLMNRIREGICAAYNISKEDQKTKSKAIYFITIFNTIVDRLSIDNVIKNKLKIFVNANGNNEAVE